MSGPVLADTNLPVRLGSQNGASRLVFDWPKMTGYKIEQNGNTLKIVFESSGKAQLPAVDPALNPQIKDIRSVSPTEIDIDLADGASFAKDFRIVRKIIIDISGGPAPAKPGQVTARNAPPEKNAPEKIAAEKTVAENKPAPPAVAEKHEPPATPEPPAKSPEPKPLPVVTVASQTAANDKNTPLPVVSPPPPALAASHDAKPANTEATGVEADNGEDANPDELPVQTADLAPTVISLSTLEPASLAVFKRNDFLLIVLDTDTGGIPPQIYGPLSGHLGNPKRVEVEGGTAFRFLYPGSSTLQISKENLSWQIIFKKVEQKVLAASQIKPEFDPPGNKNARLSVDLSAKGRILQLTDPVAGDVLTVIPAEEPAQKIDQGSRFTDLEIMPSEIGLVLRPVRDDLKFERKGKTIVVTAPGGLALTPGASAVPISMDEDGSEGPAHAKLFDFPSWRQGGLARLDENKRNIEQEILQSATPEKRSEGMLKLALLYFANNFSQEALGVLRQALNENPKLAENPGFVALRGGARALAGQYQDAIADLSIPALADQPEADLWKAYAAANTEQWIMAAKLFPKNNRMLAEYPSNIALPFTLFMAESALRLGEKERAKELLGTLNAFTAEMPDRYQAAILYLKGEAFRQDGDIEGALKAWAPVIEGRDRLYRAKASLASVNLLLEDKKISLKDAIEKIDNLRFAWRDGGLEASILHQLGSLKIENNQYLEGLKDLRSAVTIAEGNLDDSEPIAADMENAFEELFINDKAAGIPPLEAIAVFTDFNELLPPGPRGNQASRNFAEYLIRMDLLERAAELLEDQIAHHSEDGSGPELGTKLAAVYLLNSLPSKALAALEKTDSPSIPPAMKDERKLLTARAWFQQDRMELAEQALAGLETPDALRLMADIYWRTQKWRQAATTIERLLPEPGADLDDNAAQLVVNAAVALKLGDDRDALQNLKDRYLPAVARTKMAQTFNVITRKPGVSTLADRETMMKIAGEVDMFKGFLDDYKAQAAKGGG